MTDIELSGSFVDAGGIKTHLLDVGDGPPLLLVHGSGPGVSGWANWRTVLGPMSEQFRVLAPDLVGWGRTTRPAGVRYSLRGWTDQMWALLDHLDIEHVAVVGNSLGGRIGLQMAEDQPERLTKLVLMGSPGVGMTATAGLAALRAYEPSLENMRELLLNCFAYDPAIVTDDLVQIRYEASAAPGAHEAYRSMFHDPHHAGGKLEISEAQTVAVQTPTLIVHGRDDKVIPVDVAYTMNRLLPNADLHVFARCGHWTQIERAEEFNAVVGAFVQ